MENLTLITAFFLVGLSDQPMTIKALLVAFLPVYLITVSTNLLIFVLVLTSRHLHNPMYFFLANLAFLDMCYSSVTAPRMFFDLITYTRIISISACTTQVFFFLYFVISELFLLSAMSYDRYVAICRPLHYTHVMSWRVCIYIALAVWGLGCMCSLLHTLFSLRLSFCGPNLIHNFFCDLPHLFKNTCIDSSINIMVTSIGGGTGVLGAFVLTFLPYIHIFHAILRIQTKTGKLKAFSTCTSHLTVVVTFYSSIIFIYIIPTTSNLFTLNKVFSVIYALINPLLNPMIYTIRNKDLKVAILGYLHCIQPNQISRLNK
ncbi:olfactory receptor 5AR1-like [Gastrophryne carolinensis]